MAGQLIVSAGIRVAFAAAAVAIARAWLIVATRRGALTTPDTVGP